MIAPFKTLAEVREAVDSGTTVYWNGGRYTVIKHPLCYMIKGDSFMSPMEGGYKPEEFFIEEPK
jgi:hypothetical protein